MDWGYVLTAVVITLITGIISVIGILLRMIWKNTWQTFKKVEFMEQRGQLRHHENLLQFRAIFAMIKCIRTGEHNGELKKAEKELYDYIQEKAVR